MIMRQAWACAMMCVAIGCSGGDEGGGTTHDAGSDGAASSCQLEKDTTATSTSSPNGCALLTRDTSSCAASRTAQGLTGFWLDFSCRVTLTVTDGEVRATSDNLPDYKSIYFTAKSGSTYSPGCYDAFGRANPNSIVAQPITVGFPRSQTTTGSTQMHAVIGMAMNGVVIFGNRAAPGDDIYEEALTFDRCGAHPQMTGVYHYHGEPYAISYDDSRFIGVMRDGYPIYGRRDVDGKTASGLDANGGHEGVTAHSPTTPVYHYHLNEQTSTNKDTYGQKQWFLSTGTYRGTYSATCTGC